MFEGTWPTTKSKASVMWRKMRNVIIGVAQFRRGLRRRSASICSYSESEYDGTSLDSFLGDHGDEKMTVSILKKESTNSDHDPVKVQSNKEESTSTGMLVVSYNDTERHNIYVYMD